MWSLGVNSPRAVGNPPPGAWTSTPTQSFPSQALGGSHGRRLPGRAQVWAPWAGGGIFLQSASAPGEGVLRERISPGRRGSDPFGPALSVATLQSTAARKFRGPLFRPSLFGAAACGSGREHRSSPGAPGAPGGPVRRGTWEASFPPSAEPRRGTRPWLGGGSAKCADSQTSLGFPVGLGDIPGQRQGPQLKALGIPTALL